MQNALQMNEEDQNLIIALKQEIDKAWKMVDASQEKEAKAKENIQYCFMLTIILIIFFRLHLVAYYLF